MSNLNLSPILSHILSSSLTEVNQQLSLFSQDSEFNSKLILTFGNPINAQSYQQLWNSPDFNLESVIEIRSQSELNVANGAFSRDTGKIYLAEEYLQQMFPPSQGGLGGFKTSQGGLGGINEIASLILEEYGHLIDAEVNPVETIGDEGAIFAKLVQGETITPSELSDLQSEDDTATIVLDGKTLEVEQANYNLGLVEGNWNYDDSVTSSDYGDNWTFSISTTAGSSNGISVSSNSTSVDLVLELYDQNGNFIVQADQNDFNNNYEAISLNGLSAGTYIATVYDYYQGQFVNSAPYTLNINAPVPLPDLTLYTPLGWSDGIVISTVAGTNTNATQITSNDPLYVDAAWLNQGLGSTIQGYSTRLLLNGVEIASDSHSALNPNTYDFFEDFVISPLLAGNYTLTLEIDYFNSITETDETNNIWSKNFTVLSSIPQDIYEPNSNFQTATVIDTTEGYKLVSNLTIHDSLDTDFFRFTTGDLSTDEHYVAAYFDWTQGVIDFNLYDASGNFLYYTFGNFGWNYIPLSGLPAGTYYIQAGSYQQNTSPNYTLEFNTPVTLTGDRFEPNNTTYTTLGNITGFKREENLSIHSSTDVDFFSFAITEQTNNQHYIAIDFDNFQGNLDLALYDSQGRLINYQANSTDGEGISLWGLPTGTYGIGVYSGLGQTNEYDLIINAPGITSNIATDQFESNNTRSNAKPLKNFGWQQEQGFNYWENLSISQGDEDWFKFDLAQEAQLGHYIAIAFDNNQGDLDLELYNASGNIIKEAKGVRDVESINLDNITQGTYYARVVGYQGATNPNYSLLINTPGGDAFEDNNTQETAKDLTGIRTTALISWDNLSVDDDDWFKFNLSSQGTANDYVTINFNHSLGDLDLELYDSSGTKIKDSAGVSNLEQISLENLEAGNYFIRVFGYNDATNPNYSLTMNALLPVDNPNYIDAFEFNDNQGNAYNLNQQLQQGQNIITVGNDPDNRLSIHDVFNYLDNTPNDVDWFKFTIAEAGKQGNYASIVFDHTLGDLDLELYDSSGQVLETDEGVANVHEIELDDLSAGTYYLKVFGYNDATNPNYILTVDAPFNTVTGDWSEENNNSEPDTYLQAKDLETINRLFNQGNLSISADNDNNDDNNDVDWFKFEIDADGGLGDAIGINFNHQQGDLDIELYGSDGTTLLDDSASVSNNEEISLNGRDAGVYFLKVYGYDGATNPEYSLYIDAPENNDGDWAESNDIQSNAYNLRDVEGLQTWDTFSLHNGTDVDWFKFNLLDTATADDFVSILFDNTQGDLDLYLYDSWWGTLIESSLTADSFEEISLDGLSEGTYFIKVERYSQNTNAVDYELYINAPNSEENQADWAENNNDTNTAEDLQTVEGLQSFSGLSIHENMDKDWFKFETIGTGVEGHGVSIDFDHSEGDLQLYLYNSSGSLIASSTGNSNRELISFKDRSAGTYYVKIEGESNSVTNPNYTLTFDLPETSEKDWIDEGNTANDTRNNAYDLRTINDALLLSGLSIHPSTDEDWFKFTLPQNAVNGQVVRIDFNHFEGDLQLALLDSNGNSLESVNRDKNFEEISLAGKNAGTYYVKVSGDDNPNYSLTITGIPEAQPDQLEPNNSPGSAYELRDIGGSNLNSFSRSLFPSFPPDPWASTGAYVLHENHTSQNNPLPLHVIGDIANGMQQNAQFNTNALTFGLQQLPSWDINYNNVTYSNGNLNNNAILDIILGANSTAVSGLGAFGQAVNSSAFINADLSAFQQTFNQANQQPIFNTASLLPTQSNTFSFGGGLPTQSFGFNPGFPTQNFGFNNTNSYSGGFGSQTATSSQLNELGDFFGFSFRSGNSQNIAAISNLSIHSNTDQDWFKFELTQDGQAGQFISINFDHDLGDLKLELFEGFNPDIYDTEEEYEQSLVATQNGSGDSEQISLARLAEGEYYIRVSGVDGATNSNYSLSLTAPLPNEEISEDFAEPNNSSNNPYDLREVEGNRVLSGLSIHNNDDKDWFQFKTTGLGADGHLVRIDFSDDQGDLDLILHKPDGTLIKSETTENFEEISLDGLAEGTYKVEVFGYDGATNPNYTLSLSTPDNSVEPDRFEPNDDNDLNRLTTGDLDRATNLDQFENLSTLSGLSIHTGDEDFFKFTTTSKASQNHSVSIEYEGGQGELELTLYQLVDSTTVNTINSFSTGVDNKTVWLTNDGTATGQGLADGTYYIHVTGENETVANNYQLFVDVPNEVTETTTETQLDDWTIMVYMTASDLAQFAFLDINEMEYAVSQLPSTVNFAVLWDQSQESFQFPTNGSTNWNDGWGDVGRGIIQADTTNPSLLSREAQFDLNQNRVVTSFERIGEQNTGDPETLTNFVNWAKEAAPAENYALVMWDHGGGDLFGFNGDDEGNSSNPNKDSMFTDELVSALDNLKTTDNFTFDLISFDACLMAMAEVGYALQDYTDIFVGSQENEGGDGYDYTTAFSVLQRNPDQITSESLATGIVSSYQQQYVGTGTPNDTHSASNTNGFSNLVATIKTFTDTVIQNATSSDWNAIHDAYLATTAFSFEAYRDLGQFVQGIFNNSVVNTAIRQTAQTVDLALENLVIAQTTDQRNTNGLSIFLPDNYWLNVLNNIYSQEIQQYLSSNQDFFNTTGWLDFVNAFLANEPTNRSSISSDWTGSNDVSARAYNFNTLVGDNHNFSGLNLEDADDQDWYRFTITETATTGDKVAITYDKSNGQSLNFLLRYTDSNGQLIEKTATQTTTGQEISLAGLPEGEYRILVEANGAIIPDYSLSINAPGTPTDGRDWTRSNNLPSKAEDLGVMTGQTFFSGLQVNSLQPDWFEFELPKINSDQITPITVTIDPTTNQTITAQLFDPSDNNNAIASQTATGEIQLTTPNPQPGGTYQLKISSSSAVAYSLNFNPLVEEEVPQITFDLDGDGQYLAAVDGLLFYGYQNIRNLPAFLRNNLTQQLADNLINPETNPTRTTGQAIAEYLESDLEMMDIDGDGKISAAIDGLLAYGYFNIRNLPDFLRNNLTQQLADNLIPEDSMAIRTTGIDIADFMESYMI